MTAGTSSTCPLCHGRAGATFVVAGHAHYACRDCGTLFVAPLPSAKELGDLYRSATPELGSLCCWESSARHGHSTWKKALEDVRRLAGDGPLLDVGCGAGQFLAFAHAHGFGPLHGLELAPAVAAAARQRCAATVQEADLFTADLAPGAFAAVTLWDVLEHLPDPRGALRRVRSLLRPGGVVALGTPNREGLSLRALGPRSRAVAPPEHLFLATCRGLEAALAAEALVLTRLETEQIRIRDWIPGRSEGCAPGVRGGYRTAYALLTGPVALAGQRVLNVVLRAARLGDQILAVARRP